MTTPKRTRLTVLLLPKVEDDVRAVAEVTGRPVSWVVNRMLEQWIDSVVGKP